eukprot:c14918_g1_i1 orf=264-476(-)
MGERLSSASEEQRAYNIAFTGLLSSFLWGLIPINNHHHQLRKDNPQQKPILLSRSNTNAFIHQMLMLRDT